MESAPGCHGRSGKAESDTVTGTFQNRRAFLKERALSNPPFLGAVAEDAWAAARTIETVGDRPEGFKLIWLILRMMWLSDGYLPLFFWRFSVLLEGFGIPVLPTLFRRLAILIGQVHIGAPVVMEPGIVLPHGQVVIDGVVDIGRGAIIRPFVTIGLLEGGFIGPTIGPRVRIGTGAKILGEVQIGKDVLIGANAVVLDDVPDSVTVVGIPARQTAQKPE
jgi:serine O-acetyltransferase